MPNNQFLTQFGEAVNHARQSLHNGARRLLLGRATTMMDQDLKIMSLILKGIKKERSGQTDLQEIDNLENQLNQLDDLLAALDKAAVSRNKNHDEIHEKLGEMSKLLENIHKNLPKSQSQSWDDVRPENRIARFTFLLNKGMAAVERAQASVQAEAEKSRKTSRSNLTRPG